MNIEQYGKLKNSSFFVGGELAQGMDIWNPSTGTVTTAAVKQLPQEAGYAASQGLKLFGLLSVNYNTELIFTGGAIGLPTPVRIPDAWSYKYYNNSWKKLGSFSTEVAQHSNFVVYNITCP